MYSPTLIESRRTRSTRRFLSLGLVSLTIHVAVIVAAAYTAVHAGVSDDTVKVDTTLVFFDAPRQQPTPPLEQPVQLVQPLMGFETVAVPAEVPTVPPVDLQEHFNPNDFSGSAAEGSAPENRQATGGVPEADQVYSPEAVDEGPRMLSAQPPPYPRVLQDAGMGGRFLLEAIVDTMGRAEPSSIKIVESPSPGFDGPVTRWVLNARFRPARRQGRAVRVLVQVPLDYTAVTDHRGE